MYFRLWGVAFMSDCEVTLLPSSVSLVWVLFVRLAFLLMSVEKSLVWLSCFFFDLVVGVGAASPETEIHAVITANVVLRGETP